MRSSYREPVFGRTRGGLIVSGLAVSAAVIACMAGLRPMLRFLLAPVLP